jgi:DNA polymerase-1
MKKLYLIDGYGFVFRAYHSLPPLARPDGTPIGAVYGFTNMLFKLLEGHQADYIAVVLDAGQKNFRHELYEAYKANRPPAPEDLIPQLELLPQVIEAFNLPVLQKPGFEADDLIATYTMQATNSGLQVRIISSDKDLMQLVSDNVHLYDPLKNKEIGENEVLAKLGVTPKQVLDYLALVGDSSDNIPGAKGIGQKTAIELLAQFSSIEDIYNNLSQISSPRRQQLLLDSKDNVLLSKKLVSLDAQVAHQTKLEELSTRELDYIKLSEFLTAQNFLSLQSRLDKKFGQNYKVEPVKNPVSYSNQTITSQSELEKLVADLDNHTHIAILLDDISCQLASDQQQWLIPLAEAEPSNYQENIFSTEKKEVFKISLESLLSTLSPILTAPYITKVSADAKNLLKHCLQNGIELVSYEDVLVMAYSLATGKYICSLKELGKEFFNEEPEINSLLLMNLFKELSQKLFANKMWRIYERLDKPMLSCLAEIEMRGIKVDTKLLHELSTEFHHKANDIATQIFKIAGYEFNIASPKQIGEVLFNKLSLPAPKKSKTGNYTTSVDVLEKLADQGYEIASHILHWRQLSKLINTYTESLPKNINNKTGRIHTSFNLTATATGRLSSNNPNLQNIPIRTAEGSRIRRAFVAGDNKLIIAADYSQIELRLLAVLADIKELKLAFSNNSDIHAITASQMFEVPVKNVTSEMRRQAKMINFGIIYGISPMGLARRLDIPVGQASAYIDAYFKQYPGIKEYMQTTIESARTKGYVTTLLGRRCYINSINDRNFNIRSFAERAAINAPLQGTAADIIKKAMVTMPNTLRQYMVLQIHDELLFEVPEDIAPSIYAPITEAMENVIPLGVRLQVDISCGKSWLIS